MASRLKDVDTVLGALAKAKLYAGAAIAVKGGKEVFYRSYGEVMPEFGMKLKPYHRYGIGSNGKGATAVVMYILQAKGLLSVNDTIDKYVKPQDFGVPASWCPRVVNVTTGPCLYPKIHELLSHQSGLVDVALHCRYPYTTWQARACWAGPNGDPMTLNYTTPLANGAVDTKELVKRSGLFTLPMLWEPGTGYDDNNNNFVIAAYIAEKVTGMVWRDVYAKYLFEPVGMKDTFIDLAEGNDGIYKNVVPRPGLTAHITPLSLGVPAMDFEAVGPSTLQGGDIRLKEGAEGPPYGLWAKTARFVDPVVASFGFNVLHAGGAIVSTLRDQAKYFTTLTRAPERLGLDKAALKNIFTVGTALGPYNFSQGFITRVNLSLPLGTPFVHYEGNFGYSVLSYTQLDPNDPAEDMHVSVLTYMLPSIGFFRFKWAASNSTAPEKARLDPITPYLGDKVCLMSAAEEDPSSWYTPIYGWAAGQPWRSKAAYQYFSQKAKAAGSPLALGQSVPAPHFYCQVQEARGSMGQFVGSQVAEAVLGRRWALDP